LQEKTVSLEYGLAPMYQASLWSSVLRTIMEIRAHPILLNPSAAAEAKLDATVVEKPLLSD
jgi:hypothetical protein